MRNLSDVRDLLNQYGFDENVLKTAAESAEKWSALANQIESFRPEPRKMPVLRNYQMADYQYEILVESIKEFEDDLDDNHEVAVQLAAFGQSLIMQVAEIGYSNPSLVHFHGYVNGQKAHLIQHVSQLSFLLMSVPKADPEKPARRIGFVLTADED